MLVASKRTGLGNDLPRWQSDATQFVKLDRNFYLTCIAEKTNGALSGIPPNLTYAPNAGFSGADSFTFKVNDGTFDSAEATVSITVEKPAVVNIPDANLKAVLKTALKISAGQEISKGALAGLMNLIAQNQGITNLSGLEHCTSLTDLYLNDNQISNISPLANLPNLTELNLYNNQLSDLNGLANVNLPKLTKLALSNNQIRDISPLANLTNLTVLHFNGNQLTDLNGLANLTKLQALYLPGNQISNISATSNLTNLTTLWLYNNQVNDISPLIANAGIKGTIKLKGNPLNNTSLSTHIPVLEARGIKVEHDEPPKGIIKMSDSGFEASLRQALTLPTEVITQTNTVGVTDLDLANTGIVDIDVAALQTFPELELVILTGNPLSRDAVLVQIPLLETAGIKVKLERILEVTEAESQPSLVGDINGDNSVNIFDLVIMAGQFGQSGANLSGDVNGDGSVNIFDLVISAGNFGKSAVDAAPTLLTREMTFTTQQKRNIQSAIVELESMPVRSGAEELVFNLLIAILPERLPEYTQLLPNYPNPFNPETWIPFELSQDSTVLVTIYNVAGTPVRSLSVGYIQAGRYVSQSKAIYWDGKTDTGEVVSSGTYFYQIQAGDYIETRKMVILK